jgi:hypothetical protein
MGMHCATRPQCVPIFCSHRTPLSARSHLFRGLVLEVQPPGMSLKKEGGSP